MFSIDINQIKSYDFRLCNIILSPMKLLYTLILFLPLSFNASANKEYKEELKQIQKAFPNAQTIEAKKVEDPISDSPINTLIFEVKKGEVLLGFARPVETTTGCSSSCLPISYMAFFDDKGQYKELNSEVGLTKIYHAPFTEADYAKLDLLLLMAPKELSKVQNPRDMTDALSGETLKKYQDVVVKGAAYSTLRIHLYNQLSQAQIQTKLLKTRKY